MLVLGPQRAASRQWLRVVNDGVRWTQREAKLKGKGSKDMRCVEKTEPAILEALISIITCRFSALQPAELEVKIAPHPSLSSGFIILQKILRTAPPCDCKCIDP